MIMIRNIEIEQELVPPFYSTLFFSQLVQVSNIGKLHCWLKASYSRSTGFATIGFSFQRTCQCMPL